MVTTQTSTEYSDPITPFHTLHAVSATCRPVMPERAGPALFSGWFFPAAAMGRVSPKAAKAAVALLHHRGEKERRGCCREERGGRARMNNRSKTIL